VALSGKVLAAQQAVSGATVQLYAAGNTGNGSAPAALLATAAVTDANGTFSVTAGYSCPSAQTPLYVVAKGTGANTSLWLMTALGPCGSLSAGSSIVVNEVTTTASVWALAPFLSSGGAVGASCTNTAGLNNAFATAASLANLRTGSSPGAGIPATLSVPSAKLNTLANALAACAASSGGAACTQLFSAADAGGAVPTNTLDAARNIARQPGNNVSSLFSIAQGNSTFTPALSAAPSDWMLANTIQGGGMAMPTSLSVAASGSVWVSSYEGSVTEFTPAGAPVFPTGIGGSGINQSYGMALDILGDVWIANQQTSLNSGLGDVTELSPAGQVLLSGVTNGGIYFPVAVTADSNGNQWIVNYAKSTVTLLNSSGTPLSGTTGWGGNSLAFPVALAVDSNHSAWVANQAGKLPITHISADGSLVTNYDCDCDEASGIAIDQNNNLWVANYATNSISEVSNCGTLLVDAVTGGGLMQPQGIAIDGGGAVWVANYHGNTLTALSGSTAATPGSILSPASGFGADAALLDPFALAIDPSGSIWVSNAGANTLTQFVGVAVPVKTPLAGPPQLP
jgi:hypothetical protein